MRGILGRRRGKDGRFCREIPRFLSGARVWRGDSAHGGHRRALGAKKFLKIFKKEARNPKIGVREVPEGGLSAPYIGRAGRSLGAICMCLEARPLAALLEARFVRAPQLRAPAMRHQGISPLRLTHLRSSALTLRLG